MSRSFLGPIGSRQVLAARRVGPHKVGPVRMMLILLRRRPRCQGAAWCQGSTGHPFAQFRSTLTHNSQSIKRYVSFLLHCLNVLSQGER
jgi:hypothetical protein